MLQVMLERLQPTENVEFVILTSTDASDDPIDAFGRDFGVPVVRGSLEDVLGRYVQAIDVYEPDTAIRLTGDCPFADQRLIETALEAFRTAELDGIPPVGVCNHLSATRNDPMGYVAEVFQPEGLRWLDSLQLDADEREHVTLGFKRRDLLESYSCLVDDYSHMRWTIDWREDFEYMNRMFGEIGLDANAEAAAAWSKENPHPKSHGGP